MAGAAPVAAGGPSLGADSARSSRAWPQFRGQYIQFLVLFGFGRGFPK